MQSREALVACAHGLMVGRRRHMPARRMSDAQREGREVRGTPTPRTWKSPCPDRSTEEVQPGSSFLERAYWRERTYFEVLEVGLWLGVCVWIGEGDVLVGL